MDDLIDFTEQHGAVKAPAQKSTSLSSRLVLQLFSHCFNWQEAPEEIVEFEQLGTLNFFSEGGGPPTTITSTKLISGKEGGSKKNGFTYALSIGLSENQQETLITK